jgi:phosphate starvation-inducible PhoH-like protein
VATKPGKDSRVEEFELIGVEPILVFGPQDELIRQLEQNFSDLRITARSSNVKLDGSSNSVLLARRVIDELSVMVSNSHNPNSEDISRTIRMVMGESATSPSAVLSQSILSSRGKTIRAKSEGQKKYVDAIDNNTVIFGIGPAGTGKTYLAMAKAVQALQRKEVSRIILTRPAVEAGESLGFLPGTLNDKIDPYLRPLYDALHDMLEIDSIPKLMASGTIEVAPLAYMRGRTLNDSYIILDEAQNTTPEQMKMFLTRLGFNSKMIITGDITQIDLMDEPGPTDVLSFPMDELRPGSPSGLTPPGLLGDIVLCPTVAAKQAITAGHETIDELLLLTTHGVLHLLGYDHAEPEDEKEMFGLQRQILSDFYAGEAL